MHQFLLQTRSSVTRAVIVPRSTAKQQHQGRQPAHGQPGLTDHQPRIDPGTGTGTNPIDHGAYNPSSLTFYIVWQSRWQLFSGGTTTTEAIIGTTGTAVAGTWLTLEEMLLSSRNWWLMLRRTATSPMVRWILNVWFKVWDHECPTIIKYFHFYFGIKQSFSELSSGITTARGCGVGGDLVQYLQVELKLKRGKVKVELRQTNSKEESGGGQDSIPFSCTFVICINICISIFILKSGNTKLWSK